MVAETLLCYFYRGRHETNFPVKCMNVCDEFRVRITADMTEQPLDLKVLDQESRQSPQQVQQELVEVTCHPAEEVGNDSRVSGAIPTLLERLQRWTRERPRSDRSPKVTFERPPCKEISLTQWIIRRIRRIFFLTKKKDSECEDLDMTPLRYRPIGIEQLSKKTRFTKQELQFMYRGFKQECPTGVISEETFRDVYVKLFPLSKAPDDGTGRNTSMYAHYVFGTMDQEGNGHITFGDFIMGLSVLLKGTLQERINWVFNLYDINNDGYITREELIDIVASVYDLMGTHTHPGTDDNTAVEHVDRIFDKLDLNKDGVVTLDEFMEYCSKNEEMVRSLNIFESK